jgi:phage terminase large subunit-like protein
LTISPVLVRPGELGRRPQLRSVPAYSQTAGSEAVALARSCGLILDPWQADTLTDALGEIYDRAVDRWRWAAFRVGVIVSRQNGKGSILEARVLAGLTLFDEKLIIWTAHEMKTAMEAFRRVEALIEASPDLRRRVKRYVRTNGNEGIEFRNGARLRFVARSKGSGRGFTCDCLILDEAYALTSDQLAALLPTMSAVPNAQIWFTSSPPLDSDTGEVLFRLRDAAMANDPRLAYFDWGLQGVDLDNLGDVDLADPRNWATTNPAYGFRISGEFTGQEFSSMDPVAFARERLGIWPARFTGGAVIDLQIWAGLADQKSIHGRDVAFAVDVTPDRSSSSIAVYGRRLGDDEIGHVELVDHRPGTQWVVERLKLLRERWAPVAIGIDSKGPAGSLLLDLEKAGFERPAGDEKPKRGQLAVMTTTDAAGACGQFVDAVNQRGFRHIDQGPLSIAVAGAKTRPLGDAWGWARKAASVDISPLCAATVARWAYVSRIDALKKPGNPLNIW